MLIFKSVCYKQNVNRKYIKSKMPNQCNNYMILNRNRGVHAGIIVCVAKSNARWFVTSL